MHMNWYMLASRQVVHEEVDGIYNCILDPFNHELTCSMDPETAETCTCGHFNQVVQAFPSHMIQHYTIYVSLHFGKLDGGGTHPFSWINNIHLLVT